MTDDGQAVRGVRHHTEWSAAGLAAAKDGRRVSLVLPARDEEGTVGPIVRRLREAVCEAVPLVDELVVVDSDSTDATARVARAAGATVHASSGIRPDLGTRRGKGEALWKSQFVTTGDVVVFVDSDLVDWGAHFVTGLLGPLLTDPSAAIVKAVYDRPMLDADGHEVETGGRVTELVARPLLALHHPGLAGVVQPLSGEWAIRRDVLERLPVPVGYGVEIAALVDTASLCGAASVAQVDLGRRAHRHHRHDTLGPMALQVIAAVEGRLGGRHTRDGSGSAELRQFDRQGTGFRPRSTAVDVSERPPAVTVEGYATPARAGRERSGVR